MTLALSPDATTKNLFDGWYHLGAAGSEIPPSSAGEGKCGGLKSVMEQMTDGFGCNEGKDSDAGAGGEGGEENWGWGVVQSVGSYLVWHQMFNSIVTQSL